MHTQLHPSILRCVCLHPCPSLPSHHLLPPILAACQVSKKHDVVYIATKLGYVYLFDLFTGNVIFRHRVSAAPVFSVALHEATGGLICLTAKAGEVLLITVNERNLVPYVSDTLHNRPLAMALASRLGIEGAGGMYAVRRRGSASSLSSLPRLAVCVRVEGATAFVVSHAVAALCVRCAGLRARARCAVRLRSSRVLAAPVCGSGSGVAGLLQEEFARALASGEIDRAITLATSSPGGSLRNSETIRQLQAIPPVEGQQPAVLRYFAALMEKGKLNKVTPSPSSSGARARARFRETRSAGEGVCIVLCRLG
jgi:hypothetical protein